MSIKLDSAGGGYIGQRPPQTTDARVSERDSGQHPCRHLIGRIALFDDPGKRGYVYQSPCNHRGSGVVAHSQSGHTSHHQRLNVQQFIANRTTCKPLTPPSRIMRGKSLWIVDFWKACVRKYRIGCQRYDQCLAHGNPLIQDHRCVSGPVLVVLLDVLIATDEEVMLLLVAHQAPCALLAFCQRH